MGSRKKAHWKKSTPETSAPEKSAQERSAIGKERTRKKSALGKERTRKKSALGKERTRKKAHGEKSADTIILTDHTFDHCRISVSYNFKYENVCYSITNFSLSGKRENTSKTTGVK